MPSRVTFKYLKLAQESIQYFTTKRDGTRPQVWLTEECIRIARADLTRSCNTMPNGIEGQICRALRDAAAARAPGKPLWAGYTEAMLHFVERTLGMHAAVGTRNVTVHRLRARGQMCGTYSTPDFIADTMVRELTDNLAHSSCRQVDVLDLSLEAGQFPISLLIKEFPQPIRFYGVDKDPVALAIADQLCRFSRQFSDARAFRLITANQDSLKQDLPTLWPDGFSAVIGNPPWKAGHSQYHESIRTIYQPFLKGHFDLYLAFILRAHRFIRPGGYLAYVVPSTFLFNQNASDVRRLLLDSYDILSVNIYPQRSFIEVPCLIPISFLARKKLRATDRCATRISYHPSKLGGPRRPRYSETASVDHIWRHLPGQVFHPLVRSNLVFLQKIDSVQTLQDCGDLHCGARLSRLEAIPPEIPFWGIHARHIRMFHACTNVARKYGKKDSLFARPPSAEVVAARKVVFQDFRYMTHASRLVAAVGESGVAPVSTASLYLPKEPRFAHFYAALLNSTFANAWYKLRDVNRSVKLFHLRELPLIFDEESWARIGELARFCGLLWQDVHDLSPGTLLSEEQLLLGNRSRSLRWKQLRNQIDDEIFDLYKVSSRRRKEVARMVGARTF